MDYKKNKDKTIKTSYDVPAVRHAIKLLELLSESHSPLGVSEISKELDLNKNMVFRLVSTLCDEGWICQNDAGPKYTMSLTPFRITAKPVNRLAVSDAAYEPLKQLWQATGESIFHAILHDNSTLYIQHFNATKSVQIAGMIGGRYPLHCTAPGKMLLAYADKSVLEAVCSTKLKRFTDNTITEYDELKKHLINVRANKLASDDEEYGKGILCLSAPIFDYNGIMISAIGITVSTVFYNAVKMTQQFEADVRATAEKISHQLGYAGE